MTHPEIAMMRIRIYTDGRWPKRTGMFTWRFWPDFSHKFACTQAANKAAQIGISTQTGFHMASGRSF